MSPSGHPGSRIVKLLAVAAVMAVMVWVIGESLRARSRESHARPHESLLQTLRSESASHHPGTAHRSFTVSDSDESETRNLERYYQRRAYAGAPPVIPHPVAPDETFSQSCNACHERGGFVEEYSAYTPLTPHPHFENCTQCHVVDQDMENFVATEWKSVPPPLLDRAALPGGPPPIPHTMWLRDDCLSCHAGPAAPLAIRTRHPERINCIQCHVPQENSSYFTRLAHSSPDS